MSWDDVKRRARRVESALYSRLMDCTTQLNAQPAASSTTAGTSSSGTGAASSVSTAAYQQASAALQAELHHLSALCAEMSSLIQAGNVPDTQAAAATLSRYESIAAEYSSEARKLHDKAARRALFAHSSSSSATAASQQKGNDLLTREGDSLAMSIRATDSLLGAAADSRSSLHRQQGILSQTQNKLNSLASSFPAVQATMSRIRCLKQRDNLILAAVISSCILFTIWYASGKA